MPWIGLVTPTTQCFIQHAGKIILFMSNKINLTISAVHTNWKTKLMTCSFTSLVWTVLMTTHTHLWMKRFYHWKEEMNLKLNIYCGLQQISRRELRNGMRCWVLCGFLGSADIYAPCFILQSVTHARNLYTQVASVCYWPQYEAGHIYF